MSLPMKAIIKNLIALALLFIGLMYLEGFGFGAIVLCVCSLFVSSRRDLKAHRWQQPPSWRDR